MEGPQDEALELPASDSSDYQTFLETYSNQFTTSDREVLQGQVLKVSDKEVIVDIGRKIEGLVPASQFPQVNGMPAVGCRGHHRGDVRSLGRSGGRFYPPLP